MFRKKPQPVLQPQWLVVGLGNPGPQYRGTRHNVGFAVIEALSEQFRIKLDKAKHQSRYGIGMIGDTPVLLVKPLTFMNNSGRAVAPLAKEFGITPDRVLVVADDLDLNLGRVRLKPQGSSGGHNGHKSIIASLGTTEYPRLKIGIGSVARNETIDHVLNPFHPDERDAINDALKRAEKGVIAIVEIGLEAGMNVVNVG